MILIINIPAPNGASMQPVGDKQQQLVQNFKGSDIVVYAIPEGMTSKVSSNDLQLTKL